MHAQNMLLLLMPDFLQRVCMCACYARALRPVVAGAVTSEWFTLGKTRYYPQIYRRKSQLLLGIHASSRFAAAFADQIGAPADLSAHLTGRV